VSVAIGSFKLFAFSSLYSTLPRPMQQFGWMASWAHSFFEFGFFVLCVCARAASTGVAVHGFGKRCKTFSLSFVMAEARKIPTVVRFNRGFPCL